MTDTTDRSTVTLDRRESADARRDKRTDRRFTARRNEGESHDVRDRRSDSRRDELAEKIVITEEDIKQFESPPPSPKHLLSTILLIIGLLVLLAQI
jgi:hypothetical protein